MVADAGEPRHGVGTGGWQGGPAWSRCHSPQVIQSMCHSPHVIVHVSLDSCILASWTISFGS